MENKLYITRREYELKQKYVAKKICIHPQPYHLNESGKREFSMTEGRRLAKSFNCTLNDLFQENIPQMKNKDTSEDIDIIKVIHNLTSLYLSEGRGK